ncbi:hypothetical protein [Heliothis virescens ascovirus 3j]|uniref:Uncharacterized protein n=2 Tax=unclassified Ascovirus TaxID=328613 RepID=A0A2Z5UZB7_9VIRU|nr:hypothetical protein [Heliothis virescens ascovirus 3h]BBB16518.1 hypothetical protein [Heliothis virescens ascovirus 3j]
MDSLELISQRIATMEAAMWQMVEILDGMSRCDCRRGRDVAASEPCDEETRVFAGEENTNRLVKKSSDLVKSRVKYNHKQG